MRIPTNYVVLVVVFNLIVPISENTSGASGTNTPVIDFNKNTCYSVTATNGLKLGFFSYEPAYSATRPVELAFRDLPASSSGIVYLPLDSYIGCFLLYDTNNQAVPKTELGKSFRLDTGLRWGKQKVRQAGGIPEPWHVYADDSSPAIGVIYGGWTRLADFPSVKQLFRLDKPGTYRLVLEMQVFLKTGTNKDVVRFPPLEIPVVFSTAMHRRTNGGL